MRRWWQRWTDGTRKMKRNREYQRIKNRKRECKERDRRAGQHKTHITLKYEKSGWIMTYWVKLVKKPVLRVKWTIIENIKNFLIFTIHKQHCIVIARLDGICELFTQGLLCPKSFTITMNFKWRGASKNVFTLQLNTWTSTQGNA